MIGRFSRWRLQPEPTPIVHVVRDDVTANGLEALVSTAPSEVSAAVDPDRAGAPQRPDHLAPGLEIPALSLVAHNVRRPGQLAPIINGFSWDFLPSRTYFIVGRNGVGKSLLLKSMTAVRRASVRSSAAVPVYYAARDTVCDEQITPEMLLRSLCGAVLAADSLNRWGIGHCANRNVRQLSQGERTRLMLAAASVLDPPILLLDEPTLGLDQDGLSMLHRHLADRRNRRRLTVLASHELTVFEIEGGELLLLEHDLERTRISHATGRIVRATARFNEGEVDGGAPEVARALIEAQINAITQSGTPS